MLTEQDKRELRAQMLAHNHEMVVISFEEMDKIVQKAGTELKPDTRGKWEKFKNIAKLGADYTATGMDVRTVGKLVGELGTITAQVRFQPYGGKLHIILKGYPGMRQTLTAAKYGVTNAKVVTMGLGRAGAASAAKVGGIVSIVLITAYRVVDYVLTDEATLSQMVGSLATDIVKIGITVGSSLVVAAAFGGAALAIGPLVVVILTGIAVSSALELIDTELRITERVIEGLNELSEKAKSAANNTAEAIADTADTIVDTANEMTDSIIDSIFDYVIESATQIVIDLAHHTMNDLISRRPRLQ